MNIAIHRETASNEPKKKFAKENGFEEKNKIKFDKTG